jgi:DNA invertase Pin-like site-specific DNA recombinase
MTSPKLTPDHLRRKAIVYIRQSTPTQVLIHRESQRRQYGLADHARELGFQNVEVIDGDLGRSGSGLVERPGFEHLVAEICSGQVGAVFCIEASRLARNGRDWHHLIELCGLINALVIDPEGVYDPRLINDRLLLGLRGTMSEFELNLFRQRSLEAIRQKAQRGELQFRLPVGLCWTPTAKIEIDPDLRVQQAVRLIFEKLVEMGSVRQVFLGFRREGVLLPALNIDDPLGPRITWKPAQYGTILKVVSNPMYAGAYAFGKTEIRTTVVDGRARKSEGHRKPREKWAVLIRDHHPGYISWERFERNQLLLSENAYMQSRMGRKSGRGGRSLLAGLLRCGRCGRMLNVSYKGRDGSRPCFDCRAMINHGLKSCIRFSGWRPDRAVSGEVLGVIEGSAVEAALEAAGRVTQQDVEWRRALDLELEQARYEARLAARRYEGVDPENRLVASELEARWNAALEKVRELQNRMQEVETASQARPVPDKEALLALAEDLPEVWNAPQTDMRLKQRIARILIQEIVADLDEKANEIVLIIHWHGGRHSELRVARNKTGHHGKSTKIEVFDLVRQLAGQCRDEQIAVTLNRLGLRTGAGNSWDKARIRDLRSKLHLPGFDPAKPGPAMLSLEQAAAQLGTSCTSVRRLIQIKILSASQVVPYAPWQIPEEAVKSQTVIDAVKKIQARSKAPRPRDADNNQLVFSMS